MTMEEMAKVMEQVYSELQALRAAGQKEYAHTDAFRNFRTVGEYLQLDQKKVLLTYAIKHLDGIVAFVNGHKSQREDVRGRIKDLLVYLFLLYGMIEEEEK